MARGDFYQTLGIRPNATADQIRSAYRDLVKRYHPDLFSSELSKRRATEKLQQINEAYAILADEDRRREYDESRARNRTTVKQRPRAAARPATYSRKNFSGAANRALSIKLSAAVAGIVLLVFLADAVWNSFQAEEAAWILWAKTAIEPSSSQGVVSGRDWMNLGRYQSRVQCASSLREFVKKDEREGGRSVMDETGGTIGITVSIKGEEALAQEYFERKLREAGPAGAGTIPVQQQESLKQQARHEAREFIRKNGPSKRETTYACREVRFAKPESFFRKTVRSISELSP